MCVAGEDECDDDPLHVEADSGVHYIWIRRGAHHGDLRGPTADDPTELTAARALEAEIIEGWIKDYAAGDEEDGGGGSSDDDDDDDDDEPCYKILHSDQCWARKDCEWGRYGCVQRP